MKYLVIYEANGYRLRSLCTCAAWLHCDGPEQEEASKRIKESIELHIESLRNHGEPVPPPSAIETELVDAA